MTVVRRFVRSVRDRLTSTAREPTNIIVDLVERRRALEVKYGELVQIGRGKDGAVYRAPRDGVIIKLLSEYGRQFLPLTRRLLAIIDPALPAVAVSGQDHLVTDDESLRPPPSAPGEFATVLASVCDLQARLLTQGVALWDLGFGGTTNYMLRPDGVVRLIDFGGNGVLVIDADDAPEIAPPVRRNLVVASGDFLRAAFGLHLAEFPLGQRFPRAWASAIQDGDAETIAEATQVVEGQLVGSPFEPVWRVLKERDPMAADTWRTMAATLRSGDLGGALEAADIESVELAAGRATVRGYQNYDLERNSLRSVSGSSSALWATTEKDEIVDRGVAAVLREQAVESFLDIGCNLGLYVFSARVRHGIPRATGVDYNERYVTTCRSIADSVGLDGCRFETKSFGELEGTWDVVLAMGLVHHLFHRTEGYGDLVPIVDRLASLSSVACIVEFPTERDPKAAKWTTISGRPNSGVYTLEAFLDAASVSFASVEEIGTVQSTRKTFLLWH